MPPQGKQAFAHRPSLRTKEDNKDKNSTTKEDRTTKEGKQQKKVNNKRTTKEDKKNFFSRAPLTR